jgi:hypothetical protein
MYFTYLLFYIFQYLGPIFMLMPIQTLTNVSITTLLINYLQNQQIILNCDAKALFFIMLFIKQHKAKKSSFSNEKGKKPLHKLIMK